ncbi:MAG: serine/threonine protein kinase [Betaproteobacteria bacterium]|nr:serine/threonine protein kinase [Betaproteobacteria bacterium]MDH5221542.1 serine/threonine protein kinase [Betaproteobacteria bacterium]MDH5350930.1 serine/threonine protein kinase [Betaproteobacteria bacterium]
MAKKKDKDNRIGRYRILEELGRGAMGVVYRAEDPSLDRVVALKTISLADAEGRKEYEKRFLLEAKAAGKLTHPNIVTIFDYGEEEDTAYMAMELLEGSDLRSRMRREQIPPMEAVEIALQVADGLGFAHEHGVVHRDVKPGNIMLLERGAVKIMDFGIARMRFADHKTSTGMVLGTPRYMSPEQISGLPVDQRSDIFSLGTVLYEMLTQTSLFAGQNVDQIAFNVTTNEPAPPSHKNPELPQILDFIVARALKKEPSVRYQDAYEMAADLRDALAEMRGRAPARDAESETTMTQKLGAGGDKLPVAPPASAIAKDTRLPMSRVFDSDAALARLGAPGDKDRLTRAPRPVRLLRRVLRDRLPRRLAVAALLAAGLGAWIGLG